MNAASFYRQNCKSWTMDFLQNAISAEISKKRKTIESLANGSEKKKKYVSRAELERLREEEYRRQEEERIAKEEEVWSFPDSKATLSQTTDTIDRDDADESKRRY